MARLRGWASVLLGLSVGCGGGQTVSYCQAYLHCYEWTGGTKGALDSTVGAQGSCWVGGAVEAACVAKCNAELDLLIATHPDAGCLKVGDPTAGRLVPHVTGIAASCIASGRR